MTKIASISPFNPVKTGLTIMVGLSILIGGQTTTLAAFAKPPANGSANKSSLVKRTTAGTKRSAAKASKNVARGTRNGASRNSRSSAARISANRLTQIAAKAPAKTAADSKKPLIPVHADFTLENGLRVVFSEDHSVPVVAVAILYDVGARNEKKGRSGFAHLFEHMMFEGSENVGKTEHFKYVESAGGSLNGSTHPDFTNYFEKLPSNQAELALWLESDRMRSLKLTPENFQNQLETVKEEKRLNYDNQPYVPASIKFDEMLFDNWVNGHPTIGYFKDLEESSLDDVRAFFKTYYAPNNAVLVVVGDFKSSEMKPLVEKYFATIPRQEAPPKPDVAEGPMTKSKYAKVEDKHANLPAFWIGWRAPGRREPDYYVLGVIEKLLSAGESSRLYQRMVKGEKIALKSDAGYDERRGPSGFEAFVVLKPGNTPERARQVLFEELDSLKNKPVSPEELEKAKNQILRTLFANAHSSLQRSLGRAEHLGEYTLFFGDPKLIDKDLEAYMNVSAKDIQRVAKSMFNKDIVCIVDIEPKEGKEDKPTPAKVDAAEGSAPEPKKETTAPEKVDTATPGKPESPTPGSPEATKDTPAPDSGKTPTEKKESEESKK